MTINASVFIITKNEEKNIARVLESIKEFNEIIIVDSGSTDRTLEIAQQHNCKIHHQDWLGFSKQKQHAMNLCTYDWVLNLDADEEIPPQLSEEIKQHISKENISGLRFLRNDLFLGKSYPRYCKLPSNIRMYRKSHAHFDSECLVHESATIAGHIETLSTPFLHYGYNEIEALAYKQNQYSSLKSLEKFQKGKSFSYLKLLLIFPIEFIKKLIFQRYFLFGFRGFILATMNANYAFLKEAKLFSLHTTDAKK